MNTAPPAPSRHLQQDVFAKLLRAWGTWRPPRSQNSPRGRLTDVLDAFGTRSQALVGALTGGNDVDLAKVGIWQPGPAVVKGSPPLYPVATAAVWDDAGVLNACVRMLLVAIGANDEPVWWGWRFDSAEQNRPTGSATPRPHAHAQPITSWYQNGARCLLHPHSEGERAAGCPWEPSRTPPLLNETHPAFPLRGATLPGLLLAAVVSLHGVEVVRQILEANPGILKTAGSEILEDFATVLGGVV